MWSFFQFINDECTLTIVDVGAAMTDVPSYQKLIDIKRARLIGFEPDADACRRLNDSYGKPHLFLPHFVADGRPAVFHETNWGPTGSLFEPNTPLLEKFHNLGEVVIPVARHPITTVRLDDIVEVDDVDFIKIDVQGSELGIFRNASRALADAVLIQTEVCFLEVYKKQPMFSDIDAFLRANGFQFHDFVGMGSRSFKPVMSPHHPFLGFRQRVWADAYYVKDWMNWDVLPPAKLKKMAALLHDIVGSYDLAHLALEAMDRQLGSHEAPRYLRRLQEGGHCSVSGANGRANRSADDGDCLSVPGDRVGEMQSSAIRARNTESGNLHTGDEKRSAGGEVLNASPPRVNRGAIFLTTADGISVSVPATLDCITTYVLLEQERWFEREGDFVLRWLEPGMNAVDVGANVGVYCLPMARAVGAAGKVFAFEPGGENRHHLEVGRAENGLDNLFISACALSDSEKEGWLEIGSSGELNSLIDGDAAACGNAECVRVSTLDAQTQEYSWPPIDFLKIDAEGQEARIVAGGRVFFREQSPLVMYEIKSGANHNHNLRWIFEALGYATYRLLGDASCLVPLGSDDPLDSYELNLFAAKPDRAARIAADGLLVTEPENYFLSDEERNEALGSMLDLPYARSFEFSRQDIDRCEYGDALAAYAAYRFVELAPGRRYAALSAAYELLREHCAATPTPTALASLVRVALDLGRRLVAVETLTQLLGMAGAQIDQPFFPPCLRYEGLAAEGREADWFSAAAIEQMEISQAHSSRFADKGLDRLNALCTSPFASAEISRRAILRSAVTGMGLRDLVRFLNPSYQHRNSNYWSSASLAEISFLL